MTKSIQQLADEMATKCVNNLDRLNYYEGSLRRINCIRNSLALLELLEVARAVNPSLEGIPDEDLFPEQRALLNAITNLQKKVEL